MRADASVACLQRSPLREIALILCAAGLSLLGHGALAAEWNREASVSVGTVYSDNVELESQDEDSDLYGTVMPSFSVRGKGARASADLNAALEMNDRSGGGGNFNPLLNANGNAELIEGFFYTDVFARAEQTVTDPFQASSGIALSGNENTGTTYSYGVTPSIKRRFGSFATFNASTYWDQQSSSNDDFDDSNEQRFNASLLSGPDFARLSWGMTGEHRSTAYDNNAGGGNGQDDEYSEIRLPLGYRINRKLQLTSAIGHEWRSYDAQTDNEDDNTWDVGFVWTPTLRTSLNAGYENQYGDTSPRVDFTHRSKRTTFRAFYERELTTSRDLRALQPYSGIGNPFGVPFDPATGQPIPLSTNRNFLQSGSIIDERLETSLSVQGKRTTVTLTGRQSKQTREDNNQEGTFNDVYLNFSRALSAKLTLNGGVTWEGDEDPDGLTADTMRYHVVLNRNLGVNTNLSLYYSYEDRDSERLDDDYTENRVFLNLTFNL